MSGMKFLVVSITLAGVVVPQYAVANIVCDRSQTADSTQGVFYSSAGLDATLLDNYVMQRWTYEVRQQGASVEFGNDDHLQITGDPNAGTTCTGVMQLLGNHGTCTINDDGIFILTCTDASAAALSAAIQDQVLSSTPDILMFTIAAATSLLAITMLVVAAVWFHDRNNHGRREPIYNDGASDDALLRGVNGGP